MKPERQFNANEGDYSIGLAGPDAIEADLDTLARMFDPLTTHSYGEEGGISTENIQDDAIEDSLIGDRTIDDSITDNYTNTGKLGKLLSFLGKAIKAIKGTAKWYDAPADTIANIHTRVSTNTTNIANHKTSNDHDYRYYTRTQLDSGQLDNRYYTESEVDSKVSNINTAMANHKISSDHDGRYYTEIEIDSKVSLLATKAENSLKANKEDVYTKKQIDPWLAVVGGETNIKEEVFHILTSNNGDGTFYYTINGEDTIIGELLENGEQVFELIEGYYDLGLNRLEIFIGDTLRRTVKSGGIIEIDNYRFALTQPEGSGAEITVKYYERIGLSGEHNIIISKTKPLPTDGNTLWFKIIE